MRERERARAICVREILTLCSDFARKYKKARTFVWKIVFHSVIIKKSVAFMQEQEKEREKDMAQARNIFFIVRAKAKKKICDEEKMLCMS